MSDYSEAVLIGGDRPVEHVDLEVFVPPPLPPGRALLRRLSSGGGPGTLREITPTHRSLERAGPVIINAWRDHDRGAAERMIDEIARIRSDDDVRTSILGRFAHRTKVAAVVANLSDPKDAGTKKALAGSSER